MDILMDFHFIRPAVFLLAPVAIGIWWMWLQRSDDLRGWREQIDPSLLNALTTGQDTSARAPGLWLLAGWLCSVVAVAGPTWRLEPNPFADDAAPLMIVLKADASMETPDPAPSRLERAHLKIADLAAARSGKPLGLIAYAASAHLVLPPTRDTAVVAQMAAEISPDIMPALGDRLDLALLEAARVLDEGDQGGSIVVIADSVHTDADTLEALELSVPVQFLAIHAQSSPQDESLRAAARPLRASVVSLSVQDEDVSTIVRRASSAPIALRGEHGGRWQEMGYRLVPLIALFVLARFRRESRTSEVHE